MENRDIGKVGEMAFDRWAVDGEFRSVCPDPDELGVDRIFEIPLPLPDGRTPDATPPCVSGWVQIKTTTTKRRSEPIKLDICRRFVFQDTPVFLLRIHIDENSRAVDAYVLHVDAQCGSDMLKAITLTGPDAKLHRERFSVTWKAEHRVAPDGESIKRTLAKYIGDPQTYAARKREWREAAGFVGLPFKMTFEGSPLEMARHLLGDAESFEVTITHAALTRFGVERLDAELIGPERLVSVGLADGKPGTLRLRWKDKWLDVPGRFWTALGLVREIPDEVDAWRFQGGLLDVRGRKDSLTLNVGLVEGREATLAEWRASAEAAARMSGGGRCKIELIWRDSVVGLGGGVLLRRELPFPGVESVIDAGRFAAVVGIPESRLLGSEEIIEGDEVRAAFLSLYCDEDLHVELPVKPETCAELPSAAPLVLTAAHVASLGAACSVCVITTEPAPWSVDAKRKTLLVEAQVAVRSPVRVFNDRDAAAAALRDLVEEAQEKQRTSGAIHVVFRPRPLPSSSPSVGASATAP